jgi:hypothetical protein
LSSDSSSIAAAADAACTAAAAAAAKEGAPEGLRGSPTLSVLGRAKSKVLQQLGELETQLGVDKQMVRAGRGGGSTNSRCLVTGGQHHHPKYVALTSFPDH